MKDEKVAPQTTPVTTEQGVLPKKLSWFDRILNKSSLFGSAMIVTLKVLQRNYELEEKILALKDELKTHERSIIDLYERNGIVVQHVQASQRVGALDMRLPDINDNGGEKPN